jgi:glycosyltransferase involved in cell wall biosynthesis
MLRHRLYYLLKPYVPWGMRIVVRRALAQKIRRESTAVWPINPAASRLPEGWPGWPEGKKFSVVITHDVEGAQGLGKCRALMEIDRDMGFRSVFNFIPAGSYHVPDALRQELEQNGFEVGIHDLNHDGKLFESREGFSVKAKKINEYARAWGAKGFRSAFMLRNLEWMHALDIRYDSSTFDTDPFELQPDGSETIFPHWIPAPPGAKNPRGGYVELPYTLAQDSTLFLVLRQKSPELWLRKLDWIAENGGMALINVHPDYLQLDGEKASSRTYPIAYYQQLLDYIRKRYAGEYWHPTPAKMAEFIVAQEPRRVHVPRKRICMITHSVYESDNRVTRYAEALAARGDRVDVLALRRSPQTPREECIAGVHVYRIQDRFSKTERSIGAYVWPLLRFLGASSWWLTRHHAKKSYDFLHIHNMPDFLVFAGWYPKLTGVKVILDIHDIVPEFYGSKFSAGKSPRAMPALKWMERISARFADHVIIANHLWVEKYEARTGIAGKTSVFINNVDTRTFQPQTRTRNDGKIILLFPGGLQWHQGLDIALRAFTQVRAAIPNSEFHIYGDGNMKPSLIALTRELGLEGSVKFFDPVRITEIASVMANADLGIVPKRADSFGNEAYSTKIMEFMSLGVPVVASRTKIDQYYFNDSLLRFFESGNPDALAEAILEMLGNAQLRSAMTSNASEYSVKNSWNSRKADYLELVDSLPSRRNARRDAL